MSFLNLFRLFLLFAGPIVGYRVAARRGDPKPLPVIAWCTAGGAAAALALIGMMLYSEMSWFATTGDLVRAALPVVGAYALFGSILGLAASLTPVSLRRRLFLAGMSIVGLTALIGVAIDASDHVDENAPRIVVVRRGVPAKDARVYFDPGSHTLVRLKADTAGEFHAPRVAGGYVHSQLLICVPGAMPAIERVYETNVSMYEVSPLAPNTDVRGRLRLMGWIAPIPRECLST